MNTSIGPGWPTRAMIGSGRTRARIEQTVGNICEISIGSRGAKDPGRSNALPEGAILIHRVMGFIFSPQPFFPRPVLRVCDYDDDDQQFDESKRQALGCTPGGNG